MYVSLRMAVCGCVCVCVCLCRNIGCRIVREETAGPRITMYVCVCVCDTPLSLGVNELSVHRRHQERTTVVRDGEDPQCPQVHLRGQRQPGHTQPCDVSV